MNCYNCGALLTEHNFCTGCGADVVLYKKLIYASNYHYNDGLDKANVRDLSGAVDSLTECLKLNKMNIEARNLLGLVYYEMGEVTLALAEWVISKNLKPEKNLADRYIASVQNSPSLLDNLNQALRKYNQALAYCEQGSQDMAMIQLKKVLSLNPRFLRAHQLLALLYIQASEWDKAKKELAKCARIDIRNTTTLLYMKEVSVATNVEDEKTSRNRKPVEDVIKYQSGNETIIQPLNVKEPRKNFAGILFLLAGAVVGVAVALALVLPGRLAIQREQLNEESRVIGEQLDKKNAELADLQKQFDAMQLQNNELNAALEAYAGADGNLNGVEHLLKAAYTYLEDPEDMATITLELDNISPETVEAEGTSEAYKNLYSLLLEKVGTQISETYIEIGENAYRDGDYDTAITNLEKAFAYDNTDSEVLLRIGDSYKKKGDSRNAVKIYNQVIELFPNSDVSLRAEEYLAELE